MTSVLRIAAYALAALLRALAAVPLGVAGGLGGAANALEDWANRTSPAEPKISSEDDT